MAIWEEITAAKGMAALHLSRKVNVQYKTAYVLLQKLREAVGLRRDAIKLHGVVQIDGKYVGGVLRKANKKEDRKDGRKKENQNGNRMCVLALREANKHAPNRTLTRVALHETQRLPARQFLAKQHLARHRRPLEICQINPDHHILHLPSSPLRDL
ncbi:transposase [Neorhizobium galegae]|uniref:transposase n=1 Tax=Neorhizobium galegae TaxID=399 RepID=UPI0021042CAA|nr:transposase [Neorhizobium galegae]MCQ1838743.1 transposase [Neorhizobium galegae]